MTPKINENLITLDDHLDHQESSISLVSSTDLSACSYQKKFATTTTTNTDKPSLTSLLNFGISAAVFVLGIGYKECLVPSHDHAYDRPHPHQQLLTSGDVLLNFELNHPLVYPASVPSKLLFQTCIALPLAMILLVHLRSRSSWNCTLASISGLLSGIGICEVCTHMIKYYVLRRRPNFYALCQWDDAIQACTAPAKKVLEAQLSFPSGHSSIGWCGMTFLVLILLGKLKLSHQQQPTSSSSLSLLWNTWAPWFVCLVPWGWATYVATSRIADKWHHASDVVAGIMLGVACATISYHSLFPRVLSMESGTCHVELAMQRKNQ